MQIDAEDGFLDGRISSSSRRRRPTLGLSEASGKIFSSKITSREI
jgi:hypothetical protein